MICSAVVKSFFGGGGFGARLGVKGVEAKEGVLQVESSLLYKRRSTGEGGRVGAGVLTGLVLQQIPSNLFF